MFETIYNLYLVEMDGEEFDSEEDALVAANEAFREILDLRNWKFLNKTATLALLALDLSAITDLDKVLTIWYDTQELIKADFFARYDDDKDYYIDIPGNLIVPINGRTFPDVGLVVDYKYKPVSMTSDNAPLAIDSLNSAIAYRMCQKFYRKDQDLTVMTELNNKADAAIDRLINVDSNL